MSEVPELPGDVLRELREKKGFDRRLFAERTGYSYHTQFRLEEGHTPVKRVHLEAYVTGGWIEEGNGNSLYCGESYNVTFYAEDLYGATDVFSFDWVQ